MDDRRSSCRGCAIRAALMRLRWHRAHASCSDGPADLSHACLISLCCTGRHGCLSQHSQDMYKELGFHLYLNCWVLRGSVSLKPDADHVCVASTAHWICSKSHGASLAKDAINAKILQIFKEMQTFWHSMQP